MSNLQAIGLRLNNITGPFPTWLAGCSRLGWVHMDFNNFTGTVGDEFAKIPTLYVLGLTNSSLSGPLPACFGQMTSLQTLSLGGNQFTGSIPAAYGNLVNMQALDLSNNRLSGSIPDVFARWRSLTEFIVFSNALEGALPSSLSSLASLSVVAAGNNRLTSFDSALGSSASLFLLSLPNNSFTGDVPDTFNQQGAPACAIPLVDLSGSPFACPIPQWAVWTGAQCSSPSPSQPRWRGSLAESLVTKLVRKGLRHHHSSNNEGWTLFKPVGERKGTNTTGNGRADAQPVEISYWGISKCPDFTSLEQEILQINPALADIYTVAPGLMGLTAPLYPTGFWTLHGQAEVLGNMAALCVKKILSSSSSKSGDSTGLPRTGRRSNDMGQYGVYAGCMDASTKNVPLYAQQCGEKAGVPWTELRDCIVNEGPTLLASSQRGADAHRAIWSPTLYFNGDDSTKCLWHLLPCPVPNGAPDFERVICDLYQGTDKPSYCNGFL